MQLECISVFACVPDCLWSNWHCNAAQLVLAECNFVQLLSVNDLGKNAVDASAHSHVWSPADRRAHSEAVNTDHAMASQSNGKMDTH